MTSASEKVMTISSKFELNPIARTKVSGHETFQKSSFELALNRIHSKIESNEMDNFLESPLFLILVLFFLFL